MIWFSLTSYDIVYVFELTFVVRIYWVFHKVLYFRVVKLRKIRLSVNKRIL